MTVYDQLLARVRHSLKDPIMPFDMMPENRKPERPKMDRHEVAVGIQLELGRPLSTVEYTKIWNYLTTAMGQEDYLGEFVPVE